VEAKFEKVVFNIVDGIFDKVYSTFIQDKDKLWGICKEMFGFPALPTKEKKVTKPAEVKQDTTEGKTEEVKPVESKPSEPKKAARVKKMVETEAPKPVETKVDEPVAETPKPVETKVEADIPKIVEEETKPAEQSAVEATKPKMIVEEEKTDAKKCQFVLTRGPRKGEVCGSSVSTKDPSSGKCTVHLK